MADKSGKPDQLAAWFLELRDDLSFARTHYPNSRTLSYLNNLTAKAHLCIYKNKKEKTNRFLSFWLYELPLLMYSVQKELLYSFVVFAISVLIGVVSAAYDDTFVRLILGDYYVNMTLENIQKNDPLAVYKIMNQIDMFFSITLNNILVSFKTFAFGVVFSLGTVFILFNNGVMLGSFQYFFYQYDLLFSSALTIWIHGTLEISAIVIGGSAGLVVGNSLLFPQTYTRLDSFKRGANKGMKIIIGLVPVFITAGFLESFITRLTGMPDLLKILIISASAYFIVWYFMVYPRKLMNRRPKPN